jgi:hypothetical protein
MSNYMTKDQFLDIGSLTDGGTLVYNAPVPIHIKRIVLRTTTAYTVADDTVTVIVRDNDDTPTATKGSFVMAFTSSAIGDVTEVVLDSANPAATVAADGSLYSKPGPGFIELLPGQEFVLTDGGTQTAGASQVYIEFVKQGFGQSDSTNPYKSAQYTPA